MTFGGVNDHISVAYNTFLNTPSGATYEIMLYPQAAGEFLSRGKSNSNTDPNNPKIYVHADGYLHFGWSATGADTFVRSSPGAVVLNQWNHIVGIAHPGDQLRLFVNGVETTYADVSRTLPNPLPNTGDPIIIGGSIWTGRYFQGKIDVVKVYNRALSISEVQQNFHNIRSRYSL